jgi:hypothetical protein
VEEEELLPLLQVAPLPLPVVRQHLLLRRRKRRKRSLTKM